MKQKFSLPLKAKIKTIVISMMVLVLPFVCLYIIFGRELFTGNRPWLLVLFLANYSFLRSVFLMPVYTELLDDRIEVKLLLTKLVFYLPQCKVTKIDKDFYNHMTKTFNSKGLFGYTCNLRSEDEGFVRMYCRNEEDLALVETPQGKKYIINLI
ncbi:hypothetical protein [Falsiporphyromonas endometrii]|uniref:Bacterial Pleckstrin homology domain-containing protein n=1 Tax=Falsiporphyromonas endometrii TaxID=1387297 RepID=A0ABV9K9A6_9PORP